MKKLFLLAILLFVSEARSEEIWIEKLNGLIFSSKDACVGVTARCDIQIIDLYVPHERRFLERMDAFLGEPVTKSLIEDLKAEIIAFYQEEGFPIILVTLPPGQEITDGTICVQVKIARMGDLYAEGARYFSNEKILSEIRTECGEWIEEDRMMADLDWINNNPFRISGIIYEPGKEPGFTDVTIQTEDRFPLRVYGSYENTGNVLAGNSRFLAGVNWGKAFGINSQLDYLFISAINFSDWWANVASYTLPLPWRHFFKVYGSFTKTKPDPNLEGHGWTVAARYMIPYFFYFENQFYLGYEFKRTNNFLTFDLDTLLNGSLDISQFVLGYEEEADYSIGGTSFYATLYLSPGNMTAFNKTSLFEQQRRGAKSHYVYLKIEFDQYFYLPLGVLNDFTFHFQQSTEHLLPSEEFRLGGYYTVRGYEENEVLSDNGILFKWELRSPAWSLGKKKWDQELQIIGFIDIGYAWDVDPNVLDDNTAFLAGIGPGFRYKFGENVSFRLDYGWQLHTIRRLENETGDHARVHFGGTLAF